MMLTWSNQVSSVVKHTGRRTWKLKVCPTVHSTTVGYMYISTLYSTIRCGSGKQNWGEGFTDEVVDYRRYYNDSIQFNDFDF